jgi:hypothetical protein
MWQLQRGHGHVYIWFVFVIETECSECFFPLVDPHIVEPFSCATSYPLIVFVLLQDARHVASVVLRSRPFHRVAQQVHHARTPT